MTEGSTAAPMTRREVMEALVGVLLAMFVTIMSSTVVSNALPAIITDLHGTQTQYTWVVTATLLTMTASTPIWGKLSDLTSKKLLLQIALVIFIVGSVLAGLSQSTEMLIACRAIQGLAAGGLQALSQVVLAAMIPPRERGRYNGLLGGVMSLGMVGGPVIGGVIVDTSWLGWRWTFFMGIPLAFIALGVLQRTLHLPLSTRHVKVDYLGAALIVGAVSVLLVWVSFAGHSFGWASPETALYVGIGVVLLAFAVVVESRASEPIVPLWIFTERTVTLATIAGVLIGLSMFGSMVFFGQYFQIGRGYSPTEAGLLTIPMVVAMFVSSTASGSLITRYGKWKIYLVAGVTLLAGGLLLLGTLEHGTSLVLIGLFMAAMGAGMGMSMQNLVLAVQNTVPLAHMGAASSTVAFFRSLGGAIGVSALGAVLNHRVQGLIEDRMTALDPQVVAQADGVDLSNLGELPPSLRQLVAQAYGDGVGQPFLIGGLISILAIVAVLLIRESPLRETVEHDSELPAAGVVVETR